jgi:hypothetical protein
MRGLESFGDLSGDGESLIDWNRPLRDPICERWSLDQLHHQRTNAVRLLQAVDLRDVRMIERRQCLGFALEARQPIGIAREGVGQHLDRDPPTKIGVESAIHLAHAARANCRLDFVRTKSGAEL